MLKNASCRLLNTVLRWRKRQTVIGYFFLIYENVSCFLLALWTSNIETVVKIVFVLNAKIRLSFSRLRHQWPCIMAKFWKLYSGVVLADLLAIHWDAFASSARKALLKTMNINLPSNLGNCDFSCQAGWLTGIWYHLGSSKYIFWTQDE